MSHAGPPPPPPPPMHPQMGGGQMRPGTPGANGRPLQGGNMPSGQPNQPKGNNAGGQPGGQNQPNNQQKLKADQCWPKTLNTQPPCEIGKKPIYESYILRRAPTEAGQKMSWRSVRMQKMRASDADIAALNKLERNPKGIMAQYDALYSDSMREAVDSAVNDKNNIEEDPRYEWQLALIDVKQRQVGSSFWPAMETVQIRVVVKRVPRVNIPPSVQAQIQAQEKAKAQAAQLNQNAQNAQNKPKPQGQQQPGQQQMPPNQQPMHQGQPQMHPGHPQFPPEHHMHPHHQGGPLPPPMYQGAPPPGMFPPEHMHGGMPLPPPQDPRIQTLPMRRKSHPKKRNQSNAELEDLRHQLDGPTTDDDSIDFPRRPSRSRSRSRSRQRDHHMHHSPPPPSPRTRPGRSISPRRHIHNRRRRSTRKHRSGSEASSEDYEIYWSDESYSTTPSSLSGEGRRKHRNARRPHRRSDPAWSRPHSLEPGERYIPHRRSRVYNDEPPPLLLRESVIREPPQVVTRVVEVREPDYIPAELPRLPPSRMAPRRTLSYTPRPMLPEVPYPDDLGLPYTDRRMSAHLDRRHEYIDTMKRSYNHLPTRSEYEDRLSDDGFYARPGLEGRRRVDAMLAERDRARQRLDGMRRGYGSAASYDDEAEWNRYDGRYNGDFGIRAGGYR